MSNGFKEMNTDLAAVDPENGHSGFRAGRRELDLSVDTSRTQETRVEDVCNCEKSG
jgi:hypothetical protein